MDLLADVWAWLGENSKQIGALSSIVFGMSAAVVALFAYRLSFQNIYGLKPLVLVPTLGGAVDTKTGAHYATFKCEVWNRQKYAIDLKVLFARMRTVDVKGLLAASEVWHGEWVLMNDGEFVQGMELTVEPGARATFDGRFPADRGSDFELPRVCVAYFDRMAGATLYVRNALGQRRRFLTWRTKAKIGRWLLSLRGRKRGKVVRSEHVSASP